MSICVGVYVCMCDMCVCFVCFLCACVCMCVVCVYARTCVFVRSVLIEPLEWGRG